MIRFLLVPGFAAALAVGCTEPPIREGDAWPDEPATRAPRIVALMTSGDCLRCSLPLKELRAVSRARPDLALEVVVLKGEEEQVRRFFDRQRIPTRISSRKEAGFAWRAIPTHPALFVIDAEGLVVMAEYLGPSPGADVRHRAISVLDSIQGSLEPASHSSHPRTR